MTARKAKGTEVTTLPTRPAPTPSAQVPNPKPTPVTVTAPHIAAGVSNDVKQYGSAVDPFTGKTVLPADL